MSRTLACAGLALGLALATFPDRAVSQLVPPSEQPSRSARRDVPAEHRAGYRNPGGVGRRSQYYPPGNQFQNPGRGAVPVPSFGAYPDGTSRLMQLQAQQVGIQRGDALQRHIDTYGQPLRIFWLWPGLGYGPGGGMWPY